MTLAPTKLFTVTLLPLVRVGLRRYQGLCGGWRCGPLRRHEATTWLDKPEEQAVGDHRRTLVPEQGAGRSGLVIKPYPDQWPTRCENAGCDIPLPAIAPGASLGAYAFIPNDPAVVLHERLGRREDTGEQVLAYSPPVGGVVNLDYLYQYLPTVDGLSLGIMTPDGLWYVDVSGRNGETFARGELGAGPLTITQTDGPAWRWRVVEDMLFEEVPSAG